MSSDRDVIELLHTETAPAMHVNLTEVIAQGRARTRRRSATVAVAACAAAVAAIALGSSVLSSPGNDTTTPAGPSGSSVSTAPTSGTDGPHDVPAPGLTGRRSLTVGDARYALAVADGELTIDVVRDGHRERSVTGILGSGGAWRVVEGTGGHLVVVGIVPGVTDAIELKPLAGQPVQKPIVALAPGRDFTAFVVTFAKPLIAATPAADIGWRGAGQEVSWILGTEPQMAAFGVTMDGEGATPLTPYDFTQTGPTGAGTPTSVVISIDLPAARVGGTVVASLQGDLVVKDPSGMTATLAGADPESTLARGTFQLADGRTFVWGVAPAGTTAVVLHASAGATVGKPVLADLMGSWTAFAVEVEGTNPRITGIEVTLSGDRGSFSIME
ncbi:hypothetical protein [Phycicoccus sp. Root101]|uniref:hypothetical protein n=1 Tax=Phycicoccus sp. Root101 TaxID=1736421 RepID=UPI000702B65B|nr:hypothetical protein [Phycicoccus sp. Root101]KQU69533.1 hypothetical protein ASC58_06600 [Phycicoccus sp. Root101]